MAEIQIRKRFLSIEEIFHEGGPVVATPLRRAAALAVRRWPTVAPPRRMQREPRRLVVSRLRR